MLTGERVRDCARARVRSVRDTLWCVCVRGGSLAHCYIQLLFLILRLPLCLLLLRDNTGR